MSSIGVEVMIKIHIFHTGKVRVDVAIPYKTANPLAVK